MPPKRAIFHDKITSVKQFEEIISDPRKVIVLDIHKEWCGPCVCMEGVYNTLWFSIDDPENRLAFWQCSEENIPAEILTKLGELTVIPKFVIY